MPKILYLIHKCITGYSYVGIVRHILELESSTLVSYLWLNVTYIILNFYCTILLCDRAIVQHTVLSQMVPFMAFHIFMQYYNLAWLHLQLLSRYLRLWKSWSALLLFPWIISELILRILFLT